MGSKSDLDTMNLASEVLRELEIPHEIKIVSAHRTPELMYEFGFRMVFTYEGGLPEWIENEYPTAVYPIK